MEKDIVKFTIRVITDGDFSYSTRFDEKYRKSSGYVFYFYKDEYRTMYKKILSVFIEDIENTFSTTKNYVRDIFQPIIDEIKDSIEREYMFDGSFSGNYAIEISESILPNKIYLLDSSLNSKKMNITFK